MRAIAATIANKNHSRLKKSPTRFISGSIKNVMLDNYIAKSDPGFDLY